MLEAGEMVLRTEEIALWFSAWRGCTGTINLVTAWDPSCPCPLTASSWGLGAKLKSNNAGQAEKCRVLWGLIARGRD